STDIDCFQTALGVRRRVMTFLRWNRVPALGVGLVLLAGGGGDGGGTGPCSPGAATQLAKNGGDAQSWYVNNPLPTPLSVIVRDANNCPVPGVGIDWSVVTGGGGLSPTHSTTRSEEHTSELQSPCNLVCRLLLEKKKKKKK